VLPSSPAPCGRLALPLSTLLDTTPPTPTAGVPVASTAPPACRAFRLNGTVPASFWVRASPCGPTELSPTLGDVPLPGTSGPPTFLHVSLPACHGLRTPAHLPLLANAESRVWPSVCVHTLGVRNTRLCEAVPALQGTRLPRRPPGYAVDASPILCAMITTMTPPWTQDSLRVGSDSLPDRDLHPARDAKLILARQRWRSPAVGSGRDAGANAGGSQVQCLVRHGVDSGLYISPSTSRSATSFVLPVARLLATNCTRPM